MKSKRIIDIETRVMPDGGASASCRMNFNAPKDSATTAVAKSMMALDQFCNQQGLDFYLVPHDAKTGKPMSVTIQ